jgi:hypothetical protein
MVTRAKKSNKKKQNTIKVNYELEAGGKYRIDNYDKSPAFSSFLPGIGGEDGVPIWCMYVNRAQAVVSFGVDNKDNAIAEFLPATWAYQLVNVQGFRTFCKVDGSYYEPFQNDFVSANYDYSRAMWVEPDRIEIEEVNKTLGLSFNVKYFSPVNKTIGSLVRIVTISNFARKPKKVNVLDGLPLILPAGFTDFGMKSMRHITEAYASVRLACGHVPFYAAKVLAHDEAEVVKVEKGSFYAAWVAQKGKLTPIEPYVDPGMIFGAENDLVTPRKFIANNKIDREGQIWENRLTCALAPLETVIKPGQSVTMVAIVGFSPNEKMLSDFLPDFKSLEDFEKASQQSHEFINSVTLPAFTVSQEQTFDYYSQQNYLDNILRGGIPKLLPSKSGPAPLHIYSRRHGDLERDYNYFVVPPHPLSSGPGNYRDICQNRRCDVWFYPEIMDEEIRMFTGLMQADGYNPLGIEGYRWTLDKSVDPMQFCPAENDKARADFRNIFKKDFHPGQILGWANLHDVKVKDRMKWLYEILGQCDRKLVAHGHEGGYWVDHWIYIADLLEAFEAIYPDKIEQVLTEKEDVTWFDEGAYVVPRRDKYFMRSSGPLQLNAVVSGPASKTPLPPVTMLGKLCSLIATKAVTFDYDCKGIEMEAGRPGWNDSMNGVPGLFGSSTCEAAEVLRLAQWLLEHVLKLPNTALPVEVADFIDEVITDLENPKYDWDRAATIREKFRAKIHGGVSGQKRTVAGSVLERLLKGAKARAQKAVNNSIDSKMSLMHTYYMNEPVLTEAQKHTQPLADAIKAFNQKPLPLYLEGQVHWLRLMKNADDARKVYKAVKKSKLMDTSLQMYKINECLDKFPPEIGRARTFARGWFENESIWTHMSYKYLLELLRTGLNKEFFKDARTMLVPFMDPKVYGRSILENSSFLASSANPDPGTRGRGFIARLSGSTSEFIHMWLIMTVGPQPFIMKNAKLHFALKPVLPGQWFTKQSRAINWMEQDIEIPKDSFACAFMGKTLLVYHNESRKDTFGPSAVKPVKYLLDPKYQVDGDCIGPELAEKIRRRQFKRIDVWLE